MQKVRLVLTVELLCRLPLPLHLIPFVSVELARALLRQPDEENEGDEGDASGEGDERDEEEVRRERQGRQERQEQEAEHPTALKHLYLSWNKIRYQGAMALSAMLKPPHKLQMYVLNVYGNPVHHAHMSHVQIARRELLAKTSRLQAGEERGHGQTKHEKEQEERRQEQQRLARDKKVSGSGWPTDAGYDYDPDSDPVHGITESCNVYRARDSTFMRRLVADLGTPPPLPQGTHLLTHCPTCASFE